VAWGTVSSTISKLDFPPSIKKQGILHNIGIPKDITRYNTVKGEKTKNFVISGLLIPGFVIERGKWTLSIFEVVNRISF
jgi:hypothetical protein